MNKVKEKHYFAKILRSVQSCKGITEYSQNILRPYRGVVVIGFVIQPPSVDAPLQIFTKRIVPQRSLPVKHFFRRCFFHLCDFAKNGIFCELSNAVKFIFLTN